MQDFRNCLYILGLFKKTYGSIILSELSSKSYTTFPITDKMPPTLIPYNNLNKIT
jgi:hypothetical protein